LSSPFPFHPFLYNNAKKLRCHWQCNIDISENNTIFSTSERFSLTSTTTELISLITPLLPSLSLFPITTGKEALSSTFSWKFSLIF
jgi:hypothetical protein